MFEIIIKTQNSDRTLTEKIKQSVKGFISLNRTLREHLRGPPPKKETFSLTSSVLSLRQTERLLFSCCRFCPQRTMERPWGAEDDKGGGE